jgi:thioesterase domain-containing protein
VAIQPHGNGLPLFCVHPIGGEVLCYYPLSQHLGPARPFYALQAPALADPRATAHASIEQMAASYLEEIRSLRPHGPYLLGGLSFGGVVAFEIAQQLTRAGEEVPLVALFDTAASLGGDQAPAVDPAALIAGLSREQARQHGHNLELTAEDLAGLTVDEQLARALAELRTIGVVGDEIDLPLFRHFIGGYMVRREAVECYRAQPYPGRLALFRAREVDPELLRNSTPEWRERYEDPTFGWGLLAAGGVQVHQVAGYHETILAEPNARELARLIQAVLTEAEEAVSPTKDSTSVGLLNAT